MPLAPWRSPPRIPRAPALGEAVAMALLRDAQQTFAEPFEGSVVKISDRPLGRRAC
ncbi:MAG: hypothetical protein IIA02_00530 [Proteobacteria bacterium]|nr:hypothetical protein [Pseudomonadota bacterium]